jgi:hypothetical protein
MHNSGLLMTLIRLSITIAALVTCSISFAASEKPSLSLLAESPSLYKEIKSNDEELKSRIVGAWAEGVSPYGISIFRKDGSYECHIFASSQQGERLGVAKGKWWIEKGKLFNLIESADPPTLPFEKEPYVDTIVEIVDELLTLIDKDGQEYTKIKVNNY